MKEYATGSRLSNSPKGFNTYCHPTKTEGGICPKEFDDIAKEAIEAFGRLCDNGNLPKMPLVFEFTQIDS